MAELDDKVIVTKDLITDVADAIREEMDESDTYTLPTMVEKVHTLGQGGGADVKRLGITLANNTARFNLNGHEIWQLIGSNKTIVADITYIDGSNDRSYNKSCTASLKSEAGDTQTRIEASVVIYKNYTFYIRYFNMVIGASSMEDTGTYAVTDVEIPEVTDANPFFVCTNNIITCSKTFAEIEAIYGTQNVNKAIAPQLVYRTSSSGAYGIRSIYGVVTQIDADRFSFKFNMGYSTGAQWQERIIVIEYRRGDILTKLDDYDFEYQKPIVEGDGINITTQGAGNNRKSKISVDSSMIMIGNASGSVASFIDGGNDIPLKSCLVGIEPVQSGSGDPSPSNVRPITGWTECNITVADDETTPTISNVYNIEFPSEAGTVYGGTLDGTNGVLTVDKIMINAEDWTDFGVSSSTTDVVVFSKSLTSDGISTSNNFAISNRFSTNIASGVAGRLVKSGGTLYFVIAKSELSTYDSAGCEEWFDSHHTQFLFDAETPQTYNLTPTEVKTLLGINNIFADCGDVDVEYTRDATSIINWLISQINLGA